MSETINNPLPRPIGIIVLSTFAVMSLLTLTICVIDQPQVPSLARIQTLQIYCFVLIIAWYCLGVSDNPNQFSRRFLTYFTFYGIFAAMILFPLALLFWVGLILYVAWGLFERYKILTVEEPGWKLGWFTISPFLSIAWISSGLFILGGMIPLPDFPQYSAPLLEISPKQTFLDVRLLVTYVFFLILLIHSVAVTEFPNVKGFDPIKFPNIDGRGSIASAVNTVVVVINAFVRIVTVLLNLAYKTIANIAIWLSRVIGNVVSELIDSLNRIRYIETILKRFLTFILVIAFVVLVKEFSGAISELLADKNPISMTIDGKNLTLGIAILLVVLSWLSIFFLSCLWAGETILSNMRTLLSFGWLMDPPDGVSQRLTLSGSQIALIWTGVSLLVFLLTLMGVLGSTQYSLSVFTIAMIALVLLVAFVVIGNHIFKQLFRS